MRFFRDCCVSAVLESSYTLCILRFSVRRFLALTQKTLFFEVLLSAHGFRAPRKMRFFRDCCVNAVLESSYTLCILRISVRHFLARTKKPLFFELPVTGRCRAARARVCAKVLPPVVPNPCQCGWCPARRAPGCLARPIWRAGVGRAFARRIF